MVPDSPSTFLSKRMASWTPLGSARIGWLTNSAQCMFPAGQKEEDGSAHTPPFCCRLKPGTFLRGLRVETWGPQLCRVLCTTLSMHEKEALFRGRSSFILLPSPSQRFVVPLGDKLGFSHGGQNAALLPYSRFPPPYWH